MHEIGARNAIEIFFKTTKLWRCCECRQSRYWREKCYWKFLKSTKLWSGDVASAAGHDIGARNAIETFFKSTNLSLEMLRVPLVRILAREMRLNIFSSRPSFGDVASAASHDGGARTAIESFLKSTKLWRCCECLGWSKTESVVVLFSWTRTDFLRFAGIWEVH